MLSPGESAPAADLDSAIEKLKAAHASLKKEGFTQWTLSDIPTYAEEPYVCMAAFLLAPEYEKAPDPMLWQFGVAEVRSGLQLKASGSVCAEYY